MKTLTKTLSKKFATVLTTVTLSLSVAGFANASSFVAQVNSATTELCMTAASGNRVAMNKAIKSSRISKSALVYKVKCNDLNITDFVAQHGDSPEKMNNLINKGLRKGQVSITDTASL